MTGETNLLSNAEIEREEERLKAIQSFQHIGDEIARLETEIFVRRIQLRVAQARLPVVRGQNERGYYSETTQCPRCNGVGSVYFRESEEAKYIYLKCSRCFNMSMAEWERELGIENVRRTLQATDRR